MARDVEKRLRQCVRNGGIGFGFRQHDRYALGEHFASLEMLHWGTSGQVVLMTVLGGLGTLWGGVLGAGVFLMLRDVLSTSELLRDAPGVVTGAVFIVIVLGLRRGLWPTIADLVRRVSRRAVRSPESAR